jgi:hypothetical protein
MNCQSQNDENRRSVLLEKKNESFYSGRNINDTDLLSFSLLASLVLHDEH